MTLTARQAQILRMFLSGMTYRQIALELGLSPETINPSLRQSARRLGAPGIGREVLRAAVERAGERLAPLDPHPGLGRGGPTR